jgi:Uma2 family endonuclease
MSAVLKPSAHPYADLCDLPENMTGEILNGVLHTQPRPAGPHAFTASGLLMDLGATFQLGRGGPGGWWILRKPEVHYVRDTEVCVPDLAGWRRERMPAIPRGHRFEIVPDWVCEILSPGTARKDRVVKMPIYARHGVAHLWLVDPLERTLEAYDLYQSMWRVVGLFQESDRVRVAPFGALELSLSDLWAEGEEETAPDVEGR